ncbi:hypothetical protein INS49_015875 [Diaporthe citri]|uniref:uncharacterized protein n=1 Tax=Diaporthe citri TaxID=83186 RepID=UPI001C7E3B6F|nr:uncharacterized protein INS49_015875 [Diaporthe citri]KAG6356487.1 hypothetical protein INS49_015875 [Diaporthe citri]
MQSLEHLGIEHLQPLRRALINFLSAPITEFTCAQIIDGQPTSDVYATDHYVRDGLAVSDHEELCPGSKEKARAFRTDFNVLDPVLGPKILQAYQETLPASIAWKLRLLELVTSACHDIAVHLYQMDGGVHKHWEHEEFLAEKLESLPEKSLDRKVLPLPTLFWNGRYVDSSRYPNGLADVVGYWAETQIFGGVILFDRGESEEEMSNNAFIKSSCFSDLRDSAMAYTCTAAVEDALASPSHPPQKGNSKTCYDTYCRKAQTTINHHIFRNRHEVPEGPRPGTKDVINAYDWPERIEEIKIRRELAKKESGEPFDEVFLTAAMETNRQTTPTSRLWEYHKKEIMEPEPDVKKQGRPPYFFDPEK